MTEPETKLPDSVDSTEVADLKEQCHDLRRQVSMLALTFTVASFTLTAYLGLEDIRAGKDLNIVRQQRAQLAERSKAEAPGVQAFITKLGEFGEKNPDFRPILNKYGIKIVSNPPSLAPAPPTPATAPRK